MKKIYQRPEIWVETLETESPLLVDSITTIKTNLGESTLIYGGGGNGSARAGESNLWDDEEYDSNWDNL